MAEVSDKVLEEGVLVLRETVGTSTINGEAVRHFLGTAIAFSANDKGNFSDGEGPKRADYHVENVRFRPSGFRSCLQDFYSDHVVPFEEFVKMGRPKEVKYKLTASYLP